MKRMRWIQAGVALAASAIMVVGAQGSASASGDDVSVDKSWGFSMFFTYGDELTVYDRSADDHSVHAVLQHLACANVACDGKVWRDLRDHCVDTTTTGTAGSEVTTCNYDVTENLEVRICAARYHDGVINGGWYCSSMTKS
ncbi:hypothetical protein ACFQFC_06970 [Amorphoplanes digitatis]|uniref:Secreted protein n=1 Tax=Actinoplanes digitatis TaxID=1868 RepID=A0A7W7MR73_9ACTN|nr:hypothetical protein [Actinoplanes digitatis]MBB4763941.1 hypothetical protein [Actinoplanes digitatis]GID93760.1 hypothetical protein Adi01nite_31720 [Actinoplanes digitatis]